VSRQAVACLDEAFRFLARLGRHELALERVRRLEREPVSREQTVRLLAVLGRVAREYPHPPLRHRTEDFSRVLIAGLLGSRDLSEADAGELMQRLNHLAPEDRLVVRDTNRYLAARRAAPVRLRLPTTSPKPGNRPLLERCFELPRQIEWLKLRSEWHWF